LILALLWLKKKFERLEGLSEYKIVNFTCKIVHNEEILEEIKRNNNIHEE
jgi:hypothetical protein